MESNNIYCMYFVLYIADPRIERTFHFVYFQPVPKDVAFRFFFIFCILLPPVLFPSSLKFELIFVAVL